MRYCVHYSDYNPHLCRHVYHNVSAVVRSGLLQVVGMSYLTLYFAYWGRLFKLHEPCLVDVSSLLLISHLKVFHCLHRVLNSHFWGMPVALTNAFTHCTSAHIAILLLSLHVFFYQSSYCNFVVITAFLWYSLLLVPILYHIPVYQPLRSGRIWHKVNFKAEFNRFEFRVFLLY